MFNQLSQIQSFAFSFWFILVIAFWISIVYVCYLLIKEKLLKK